MAITAPAEGAVLATDEISSVHYPRTKVGFGAAGNYADVSDAAPLPVEVVAGGGGDASAALQTAGNNLLTALVGATDGLEAAIAALTTALGSPLQAGGNVAVTGSALPTGAATSAKQDSGITALGLLLTEATFTTRTPTLGQKAGSGSRSIVPASDATFNVALAQAEYETVAASQTDQVLGATGAAGDYLSGVLIVPASTSPGAVSIKDGSGSAITIFTGGASSVSNLVPFFVPLGIKCAGAGWKVTTGASVSAIGVGDFT